MDKVNAQPVETGIAFSKGMEIVRVEYSLDNLRAYIRDMNTKSEHLVEFSGILGFRVLDEGNLMEFWPECSTVNGWFFEIHSGGWLSQEANSHFAATLPEAKEYFVAGVDDCLSVISLATPVVHKVSGPGHR